MPSDQPRRTAYVVKVYPRFSETFVVTEILARESAGEDLAVYALRPTSDSRFHDDDSGGEDGSVPLDKIVGRALFIVWPIDHVTWLGVPARTFEAVRGTTPGPAPTPTGSATRGPAGSAPAALAASVG